MVEFDSAGKFISDYLYGLRIFELVNPNQCKIIEIVPQD